MTMPILSRKTFATNSLKLTFVWDVWFLGQIVYFKIEPPSIINKMNSTPFPTKFLKNFTAKVQQEKNYHVFSEIDSGLKCLEHH